MPITKNKLSIPDGLDIRKMADLGMQLAAFVVLLLLIVGSMGRVFFLYWKVGSNVYELDNVALAAYSGATAAEVVAMFTIVLKYLFK